VLGLDHYAPYLLSAFAITVLVLVGYVLYLRSRLLGLRRRAASVDAGYSGRNVSAAAPRVTTAQAASSANGPSTP
jgi:CcmD family protein